MLIWFSIFFLDTVLPERKSSCSLFRCFQCSSPFKDQGPVSFLLNKRFPQSPLPTFAVRACPPYFRVLLLLASQSSFSPSLSAPRFSELDAGPSPGLVTLFFWVRAERQLLVSPAVSISDRPPSGPSPFFLSFEGHRPFFGVSSSPPCFLSGSNPTSVTRFPNPPSLSGDFFGARIIKVRFGVDSFL